MILNESNRSGMPLVMVSNCASMPTRDGVTKMQLPHLPHWVNLISSSANNQYANGTMSYCLPCVNYLPYPSWQMKVYSRTTMQKGSYTIMHALISISNLQKAAAFMKQ